MTVRPSLASYIPVADMLAQTFGPTCEVVLHDLTDPQRSVVYVANGTVTGRTVGQSFDQLVKQVILSSDLKDTYVANYYFTAENGRQIRSSTLLIRGEDGELEGALCINLDTEPFRQQMEFLNRFLPQPAALVSEKPAPSDDEPEGHVAEMVTALIDNIIGDGPTDALSREERVEKVRFMEAKGIFLMKGSVEQVAQRLGINKVTVYSYLDEIRKG